MRKTFAIIKAATPWLLMVTFLVIGVIAVNSQKIVVDGNLKFEAKEGL